MVAVQVTDHDIIDLAKFDVIFLKQQLRAFPTIDQKVSILNPQKLCGMMSVVGKGSRIGT